MPKVICTNPNASDNINGVAFALVDDVMTSETIDESTAKYFLSIPGYSLAAEGSGEKPKTPPAGSK